MEKAGGGFVLRAEPGVRVAARAHKMSKSRGNVVNPDDVVAAYGADSLRLYEMFMGPLRDTKARRFLYQGQMQALGSLCLEVMGIDCMGCSWGRCATPKRAAAGSRIALPGCHWDQVHGMFIGPMRDAKARLGWRMPFRANL